MLVRNIMTNRFVSELPGENEAFVDFIQESIRLLLSVEKPFLICQKEGLPPICLHRDEDGIWVALPSEF